MKIKYVIIAAIFFLNTHFAHAQTGVINCGIQYFYDAAGNRIMRMAVACAPETLPSGDTKFLAVSTDSTSSHVDSNALSTFQIVMISPNPTLGPITIACNQNLTNANVTVIDINGQVAYQTTANGMNFQLDISHLVAGNYTVVVTSNGTPTAKTVIKMH